MPIVESPSEIKEILKASRSVAVIGAHVRKHKPAYYVPRYLENAGYAVYPVNPAFAGQDLFGGTFARSVKDIDPPINIVDIFRRAEALSEHVDDILAMAPLPKVVWFQLGIRNDEVARTFSEAGIRVVQDRCMLADHQYLL